MPPIRGHVIHFNDYWTGGLGHFGELWGTSGRVDVVDLYIWLLLTTKLINVGSNLVPQ